MNRTYVEAISPVGIVKTCMRLSEKGNYVNVSITSGYVDVFVEAKNGDAFRGYTHDDAFRPDLDIINKFYLFVEEIEKGESDAENRKCCCENSGK